MLSKYATIRNQAKLHRSLPHFRRRYTSNSLVNDLPVIPPSQARVVICGGGVMGASVAYHLGKLGWAAETVLLEQNR